MDATDVTVRSVRSVGPDTIAIELEAPPEFDALPGHFVLLRATVDGEEVSRHYTLSSPGVDDTFEITVGVDPTGDLSPWLADREPGDAVTVEGPFGTVVYDPETDGDVVAIGGGPGVGPAVAVGEAAATAGNSVSVVYEDDQPVHEARLAALASLPKDSRGSSFDVRDAKRLSPPSADRWTCSRSNPNSSNSAGLPA